MLVKTMKGFYFIGKNYISIPKEPFISQVCLLIVLIEYSITSFKSSQNYSTHSTVLSKLQKINYKKLWEPGNTRTVIQE